MCVCVSVSVPCCRATRCHTISAASLWATRYSNTLHDLAEALRRMLSRMPLTLSLPIANRSKEILFPEFSKWNRNHGTFDSGATAIKGAASQVLLFLQWNPHPMSGRNVHLLIIFNKYIDLIQSQHLKTKTKTFHKSGGECERRKRGAERDRIIHFVLPILIIITKLGRNKLNNRL